MSDLHLEFYKGHLNKQAFIDSLIQSADVLVIAGDLHVGMKNTKEALTYFSTFYKHVVYTPGNHEYYSGLDLDEFVLKDLPSNVYFLNPGTVVINGVSFIVSTLWTDFHNDTNAEYHYLAGINDARRIKGATVANVRQMHHKHVSYMKGAYDNRITKQVVFVSHFLPDITLCHPRYAGSPLNKYFAANLGSWMYSLDPAQPTYNEVVHGDSLLGTDPSVMWLFGHTHDQTDKMIGKVRCLSNPSGYPGERDRSNITLVIDTEEKKVTWS